MKQTNNAIKFLMAQYRAIFKNANIAMAVALATAALAAGQAQAAPNDNVLDLGTKDNVTASDVVNQAINISGGSSGGYIDELTIASGGALTSDGSTTAHTNWIRVGNTLNIEAGGSLVLKGKVGTQNDGDGWGIVGTYDDSYEDKDATLNVNGGKVDINASVIQMHHVNLNDAEITIGTNINDKPGANSDFSDNATITSLTNPAGGGDFTVSGKSKITLNSGSILNADTFYLDSGDIAMNSTADSGKAAVIRAYGSGIVNLDGANVTASGSGNYIGGSNISITAGTIKVNDQSTLYLTGNLDKNKNLADAQSAGNISVTGGKLEVVKGGTLNLNGVATFADGTVANAGTIDTVSGSTINVNSVAGLFGYAADAGQLKLAKNVTLNVTGNGSVDLSTANISGDATSALVAENGSVTLANGFEKKTPNVTAGTLVAKAAKIKDTVSSFYDDKRIGLIIQSGDVTALNEVKGSEPNSELVIYNSASGTASLTLGNAQTTNGKLTNISRVNVGLEVTDKAPKHNLNINGKWDFAASRLSVGNVATVKINQGAVVDNVESLQIHGKATNSTTIDIDGTMNIGRLLANEGTYSELAGSINVAGALNIYGNGNENDASATKPKEYDNDVQLGKANLNILAGGTVTLAAKDAWDDVLKVTTNETTGVSAIEVVASGDKTTDFGGWKKDLVNLGAGGTLKIDLSGYTVADKAALDKLQGDLVKSGSAGLIDLGGISVGSITTNADGSVDIANMPNVKTEATKDLEVNVGNTTTLTGSYSMGSANVGGATLTTASGSTLEFNNAKNGQFATNTSAAAGADSKVDISLAANSALNLNGNGSLGDINAGSHTGTAVVLGGNNGTQTVGAVTVGEMNVVGGNVTTGAISVTSGSAVNGVINATGDVSTKTLDIGDAGAIYAAGQTITVSDANTAAFIMGDVEAGSLTLSGGGTIAGEAQVDLGILEIANQKTLNVGRDGENGSSATVFADTVKMGSGSVIFVDPEYTSKATVLATKTLTDGTAADGVNVAQGDILVGKNAAFGIGFDQAEFDSVMANYLVNGAFTDPAAGKGGYANAFVLNAPLTIKSGSGIAVDYTLTDANVAGGAATEDTLELGANAALIITDKAFGPNKTGTAITFGDTTAGVANADVTADATSVISLVGDFDAKDTNLKIFAAVNQNAAGTVTVATPIKVEALGGLLEGSLSNGTLNSLALSPEAKTMAYAGVSRPVGDFFLGLANGDYAVDSSQLGHQFVTTIMNTAGGFQVVDTAAHAATYAGAQQAAVASVTTMADAVVGRVGTLGVEAASISATGSQANGGVWVTPMYKSMDSDGFDAQGASYGSDVDLAGVAFGADTVNGNMRFGAVFNLGSGDADGKGQGNGLKDEFDYYGFGIYSAMGFGNFALVGDASLTVINHDVEGLGLNGEADTSAITMGVTGQYTFATPMIDVTPHLGARFIRLDTDSYALNSADGTIANTDFEVQNVFSVPLGVTLSKAFTSGGWALAPSADFTLTFNTGDTEAESTTTFTGISHGIGMSTEVLDEVQYGLTLGASAQYGAFGTTFGVNYTGSSNTDSFGVNAQARYVF